MGANLFGPNQNLTQTDVVVSKICETLNFQGECLSLSFCHVCKTLTYRSDHCV